MDIRDELKTKQLNLTKIFTLSDTDKKIVIDIFSELIKSFDIYPNGGLKGMILYKTLIDNDYLTTIRDKNLDILLG